MILVKLTDKDSNIYYISDVGIAIDGKFWKPKLSSLSSIQMRPDHEYGGMVRIQGYGSLSIMPDTLPWPLPIKLSVEVKYADEQENISDLFSATAYIKKIGQDEINYNLYNPEYEVELLDKEYLEEGSGFTATYTVAAGVVDSVSILTGGTGYTTGIIIIDHPTGEGFSAEFTSTAGVVDTITIIDGGTGYTLGTPLEAVKETGRVYPLAIGEISMELPMKLGEEYEYIYYKAGISGTDPTEETGDYEIYDDGAQKDKFNGINTKGTLIDSTYKPISGIVINNPGINYTTGTLTISGGAGSSFSASYTSTGGVIDSVTILNVGSGYNNTGTVVIDDDNSTGTDANFGYYVYDTEDTFKSVIYNKGDIFNKPYGDIRFSGTNDDIGTLVELFTWAVLRFNNELEVTYTLDITYARSPSPSVNLYIDKQSQLLDFLSEVSAYCTHCFYIDENTSTFHLVDMFEDNDVTELSFGTNNEVTLFFDAEYEYPDPIKYLEIGWKYFKPDKDEHEYPVFVEKDFSYTLDFKNQFGREEKIECYNRVNEDEEVATEVSDAIDNIGKLLKDPDVKLEIPFDLDIVVPGRRYNFMDSKTYLQSTVSMRTHTIEFSPLDLTTKIIGKFILS